MIIIDLKLLTNIMRRMFSLNCERRLRIYKMGLQMHSLTRGQPGDKIVPGKSYLCSYLNIFPHIYIQIYGHVWNSGRKWSQGILIYVHIQIYKADSPPLSDINLNWTSIFSNTLLATPVALHPTLVK